MRITSILINLPYIFLLFVTSAMSVNGQTNVAILSDDAYVYSEPDTQSTPKFRVQKGDIFHVANIQKDWIQIHLFSGANRYIKSNYSEFVFDVPPYPSAPATRNKLCQKVHEAKRKASQHASRKHEDVIQQASTEQLLTDKYLLDIFRENNIAASHYSKLMECVDDGLF